MIEITPLILSIATEACVAAAIVKWRAWGSPTKAALIAATSTLVTQPLAWRGVLILYGPLDYWESIALVEIGASLAEAFAYRIAGFVTRRSIALSLGANIASATIGFIL